MPSIPMTQASSLASKAKTDLLVFRSCRMVGSFRGRVSGNDRQRSFLMKDLVLLSVCFYLLKQDVLRAALQAVGKAQWTNGPKRAARQML